MRQTINLGIADFEGHMRGIYATDPNFCIKMRKFELRQRIGNAALVTYQEWQRDALDSDGSAGHG